MTRGALSPEDVRTIEAHRAKPRPTPWPALAQILGRCEADLRAAYSTAPTTPVIVASAPAVFAPSPSPPPAKARMSEPERQEFWSHERITKLFTLYILGPHTAAETAAQLGCTRNAVCSKAARFGGKLNASPAVRRAA